MRSSSSPTQNVSGFSGDNRLFQRTDTTPSNVCSVIPGCILRLPSCDGE